jgi:hypothetical protein
LIHEAAKRWIIHRPKSLLDDEKGATQNPPATKCCTAAPPVMEFDPDGNLLRSWGGSGQGYDWPQSEHGSAHVVTRGWTRDFASTVLRRDERCAGQTLRMTIERARNPPSRLRFAPTQHFPPRREP